LSYWEEVGGDFKCRYVEGLKLLIGYQITHEKETFYIIHSKNLMLLGSFEKWLARVKLFKWNQTEIMAIWVGKISMVIFSPLIFSFSK